jgi:hypothetical protein
MDYFQKVMTSKHNDDLKLALSFTGQTVAGNAVEMVPEDMDVEDGPQDYVSDNGDGEAGGPTSVVQDEMLTLVRQVEGTGMGEKDKNGEGVGKKGGLEKSKEGGGCRRNCPRMDRRTFINLAKYPIRWPNGPNRRLFGHAHCFTGPGNLYESCGFRHLP